jgi:hypothetical protein
MMNATATRVGAVARLPRDGLGEDPVVGFAISAITVAGSGLEATSVENPGSSEARGKPRLDDVEARTRGSLSELAQSDEDTAIYTAVKRLAAFEFPQKNAASIRNADPAPCTTACTLETSTPSASGMPNMPSFPTSAISGAAD